MRATLVAVLLVALLGLAGCASKATTSGSGRTSTADRLVEEAANTLRTELDNGSKPWLNDLIARARGIMIIPTMGNVSFFFSVGGGNAVVMARPGEQWTGPVFLTKGSGGFGFQAGVTRRSGIILYMNEDDLRYVLETGAVLQANASYTFLDANHDINRTPEFNSIGDVVFVGDVSGLYAGAAFNAGGFSNRDGLNAAYHELADGTPEAILFDGKPAPAAAWDIVEQLHAAERMAREAEATKKDGTEVPSE